jgi:DNA modification methylase
MTNTWKIQQGNCLDLLTEMPEQSVQTCVTSPPYWGLRDYGEADQLGLEQTPEEYTANMVEVFREVRRVLRDDGTLWLNLGDSYAGSWGAQSRSMGAVSDKSTLRGNGHVGGGPKIKGLSGTQIEAHPKGTHTGSWVNDHPDLKPKDLVGIPWRVAFALQADGWYLRSDIIWAKPNPMPESVTDRPTKAHEYLFLLTKSPRYVYDADAIKEEASPVNGEIRFGGNKYGDSDDPKHATKSGNVYKNSGYRNKRTVWTVTTQSFKGAHFAVFPPKLIEPCVLAGAPEGATVLDPFSGSGTTGMVALRHNRSYIGLELNPEYAEMSRRRIIDDSPLLNGASL